jgi:hypothetical protein
MKPQAPKAPAPRGDVEVGDQIYIHHNGGPCCGRVVCHGKHGATVDVDGKPHKVKWDKVLGHKQRMPMRFNVVEHGEDGMLVEDGQGKRRFMRVPPDARETGAALAKALSAMQQPNNITFMQNDREIILFFKAAPAGQQIQRQPVDKPAPDAEGKDAAAAGWTPRAEGAGAPQQGQHVAFRNGEHRGHGQVAAAGEHGVTVVDGAQGEHRIKHEQVTHDWSGEGEPDQPPPADEQADEEVLGGYDGKVALPGELVAKLLKGADKELRAEVAEFLREKNAGAEVEQKAVDATPQESDERQEKVGDK